MAKKIGPEIILLFLAAGYYLLFLHRGIVLNDEGYYALNAERILNGNIPYKDFFLQFSPGYFYLLALVYKIFGMSIATGRYFTLIICLGILFLVFRILNYYKLQSLRYKIISFFAVISFGFPLINNMATLAWISVFISLFILYSFLIWVRRKDNGSLFLLGFSLAFSLFVKQSIGIYFSVLLTVFVFISSEGSLTQKLKKVFIMDVVITILSAFWLYVFFFQNNLAGFFELIDFNKRYLFIYPFSYPSFNLLFSLTGIFKLVPYYLPVFVFIFVLLYLYKGKRKYSDAIFPLIALVGFMGEVFPTSDLLHVYPFFGLILVSIIIYFHNTTRYAVWIAVVILTIGIGFYLTLFREYYRYQEPYRFQNTELSLPRTQGILVDKGLATSIPQIYHFLNNHLSPSKPVLMYPFDETLYFILQRPDPSRFSIYYPGYLTTAQENEVIQNLKEKHIQYIVTDGNYIFNTPLSQFIQTKKKVFVSGQFAVFSLY